jgi:hypothetical protein
LAQQALFQGDKKTTRWLGVKSDQKRHDAHCWHLITYCQVKFEMAMIFQFVAQNPVKHYLQLF